MVDVVLDASFIKAWSIRHQADNQIGYSNADARVGRSGDLLQAVSTVILSLGVLWRRRLFHILLIT